MAANCLILLAFMHEALFLISGYAIMSNMSVDSATGKMNLIARLVVKDGEGKIIDSNEQSVVRVQVTVSRIAYIVKWGYNLFDTYDLAGIPIYKALVFLLLAGSVTLFFGILVHQPWALMTLFCIFFLLS